MKNINNIKSKIKSSNKIDDILDYNLEYIPNQICLETSSETISFVNLEKKVSLLCAMFLDLDLTEGDRIALLSKNSFVFSELMFACSRLNIVLVPLNFRLTKLEIEYIINDSGSKILLHGEEFEDILMDLKKNCQTLKKKISLKNNNLDTMPQKKIMRNLKVQNSTNIPLFQMYTSGTTGKPKGALITHKNILTLIFDGINKLGPFDEKSISLVCMPLFHIAGSAWLFFGLAAGCRNILIVDIDPKEIINVIKSKNITCTLMVPSLIHMICEEAEKNRIKIENLKTLVFGASPMPADLINRARLIFPNADLIHVYGLTETTGMFMSLDPKELKNNRIESCGKCFDQSEIKIVDDNGNIVPKNVIGEIICKSPQVMLGYFNNKKVTAKSIRNDWFFTGDAGYIDDDGYLFLKDRIKDVIISGGENIYSVEVENFLLNHPSISEIAVVGSPDIKWGEKVVAIVVSNEKNKNLLEKNIRSFCIGKLANFKIPKQFIFIDSLPKNAAGKVTKEKLRERILLGEY